MTMKEIADRLRAASLGPRFVCDLLAAELAILHVRLENTEERLDKLEQPKRVEFDSLVLKPDGMPKDLGFQGPTSYESLFKPEHTPEERIRSAVADLRHTIGEYVKGRNLEAAHEYLDCITRNLKKLLDQPQCAVNKCTKVATHPAAYKGKGVCDEHYEGAA